MADSVSTNESDETAPKPFPKLELLKMMQLEAEGLLAARDRAIVMHRSRDIRAAGGEVEAAVRAALRKRMPTAFGVSHGHVVNPMLATSSELDVIISDVSRMPPLLTAANGTEWSPYERVLAFGEVKSSYDKSKKYVEAFVETIRRAKTQLGWPKRSVSATAYHKGGATTSTVDLSPVFTFMVFVDSISFDPADIKSLYRKTPPQYLPNLIYFVDRGVLVNMKFGGKDGNYPMEMNLHPEIADKIGLVENKSRWCLRLFRDDDPELGLGIAFFTFYYLLTSHLESFSAPSGTIMPYYALAQRDMGQECTLISLNDPIGCCDGRRVKLRKSRPCVPGQFCYLSLRLLRTTNSYSVARRLSTETSSSISSQ